MAIAPDFTSVFSKEWEIHITQCSPNGELRHTELCNYLQLTAAAHSEKGGISYTDMQEFDQAWVLSRMRLEIDKMPMFGQKIIIKTWIVSLISSRSVRALEVYLNGVKIIGCETFWAVFNTVKRRPELLALPDAHFEKYSDRYPTAQRVSRIALPENQEPIAARKVQYSDLDIVNHVNHIKYLEWCLDATDTNKLLSRKMASINMNFMKELVLGDQVAITEHMMAQQSIFTVLKEDHTCFALQIEWKNR